MTKLYSSHDILVFPSRQEGFGMCVLEAMKSGAVPVTYNLEAGIPDMVDPGVSGLVCEMGNTLQMAAGIAELSRDRRKLERMSRVAKESSRATFSPEFASSAIDAAIRDAGAFRPTSKFQVLPLSRLDQRWIPNAVVRVFRKVRKQARKR